MGTEVATVQVKTIYQTMYARMGKQPWLEEWQETPWEVVYGGILVQNTSWRNVVPSLNNLKLNFNFKPTSSGVACITRDWPRNGGLRNDVRV